MSESSCTFDACCDRGYLSQGKCICDYGFFGDYCESKISEIFTPQYYIFIGLFCIVFLYTLINASYQLYHKIFDKNLTIEEKSQKSIKLLVATPVNIILTLSCLLSLVKLLWLILDPLQVYQGRTIVFEHVLNDISYTILLYIYGYILITWYTMYAEISYYLSNQNNNENNQKNESNPLIYKHYKKVVKLRLFLVLLIQIAVSIFTGLRLEIDYPHFAMICYSFLLINFFIFIFEFALYGIKLQNCIRQQFKQFQQEKKKKIKNLITMKEELQQQLEQIEADVSFQQNNQIQKIEISPSIKSSRRPSEDLPQVIVSVLNNQKDRQRKKNVTFCKNSSSFMYYRQGSHQNINTNNEIKEVIAEQVEMNEGGTNIVQNINNESCCLDESIKEIDWICDKQDQEIIKNAIQRKLEIVRDAKEKVHCDQVQIVIPQKLNNQKQIEISNLSDQSQDQIYTQIGQQIDAFEQQKDLEDQQLQQKSSSFDADKNILKKIMLLVLLGIIYEIMFGIMSIIALISEAIYSTPIGTIIYLYISCTLQFLSLFNVLKLFKDFRTQQSQNFIWIQKIGSKKTDLNQNYSFIIPQEYKQEDDMLRKFESRINLITLY
ncbi:unnamed protein product [Paramecium sonneborni]|uniref:EGF-like domain-containing protein n=1 Tax=Paramecium sonneborni TaxID=65129 RepID=A0A8S1NC24_9CILI|nr:unnamed protein product [Paramecium sonneborni]